MFDNLSRSLGDLLREIPGLPEMRPLTLEDCALFRGLLAARPPLQSELTFTNLFMWREAYSLRVARHEEAVLVFSWRPDPEDSFLFPPLGEANEDAVRAGLRVLGEAGHEAKLARVTRADLERLGLTEERYEIRSDREQWDYVYQVSDLIELRGNKYHDKRNHLEQFLREHEYAYRPLTPELAPACKDLHDRWCDEKHCDLYATLRAEVRAVKEVLDNYEALGVTGGCLEIAGRIEAFTLGELLDPETVVIHIEKANAQYHGLYQLINQQFLAQEWAALPFVNREQDLGIEGLRRAKQSYNPHHLVEKFEVRLK
jgi:hypothetical protein